jgi:hypothetical protein
MDSTKQQSEMSSFVVCDPGCLWIVKVPIPCLHSDEISTGLPYISYIATNLVSF